MNRDLDAALTVIAIGYDVNVIINGIDIGIRGQKSESVKLFGIQSKMARVLPEDMKGQACLKEGENLITVESKYTDAESLAELTIELQAKDQFVNGATLLSKTEKMDIGKKKSFTESFIL